MPTTIPLPYHTNFQRRQKHFKHINKKDKPNTQIINDVYTQFLEILSENKTTQKHNLQLINNKKTYTLPTAYVLPKAKDTTRSRPINPHYNHILSKAFTATARCIEHILTKISENIPSFTILEAKQLKQNITKINAHIQQQFTQNKLSCKYHHYKGDIKNMYTELPHKNILEAINWACTIYKNISRTRAPVIHMYPQPKHQNTHPEHPISQTLKQPHLHYNK